MQAAVAPLCKQNALLSALQMRRRAHSIQHSSTPNYSAPGRVMGQLGMIYSLQTNHGWYLPLCTSNHRQGALSSLVLMHAEGSHSYRI